MKLSLAEKIQLWDTVNTYAATVVNKQKTPRELAVVGVEQAVEQILRDRLKEADKLLEALEGQQAMPDEILEQRLAAWRKTLI